MEFEDDLGGEASEFDRVTSHVPDTLSGDPMGNGPVIEGETAESQPERQSGLTPAAISSTLRYLSIFAAYSIEGGEFWRMDKDETDNLADAWHPILAPLWDRFMKDTNGMWLPAIMMTTATFGPRVDQEIIRRESMKANMATGKSGASSTSPGQPEAVRVMRPTDL